MLLGKEPICLFSSVSLSPGKWIFKCSHQSLDAFPFEDIFLRGLLQASVKSFCLSSEHMCIRSMHPWMEHGAEHKLVFSVFQQGL